MRTGALQVAASKPNGRATTTQLKDETHRYIDLTPEDQIASQWTRGKTRLELFPRYEWENTP
jgi:hypothetical protein